MIKAKKDLQDLVLSKLEADGISIILDDWNTIKESLANTAIPEICLRIAKEIRENSERPAYATYSNRVGWHITFYMAIYEDGVKSTGGLQGYGGTETLKKRLSEYGAENTPIFDLSNVKSLNYVNYLPRETSILGNVSLADFFKIMQECGAKKIN